MLPATVHTRLDALEQISRQGKKINGLFRLMESPDLWLQAYANRYPNQGAVTRGIDAVTMDGLVSRPPPCRSPAELEMHELMARRAG